MKNRHHWHVVGKGRGPGGGGFGSIEHEHDVNEGRPHVHCNDGGVVYTGPDVEREPMPEQVRGGPVRPLPA